MCDSSFAGGFSFVEWQTKIEPRIRIEGARSIDIVAVPLERAGNYDPREEQPADAFFGPFTQYRLINGSFEGGLSLFSMGMDSKIDLARHKWFEFDCSDAYQCVGQMGQDQDAMMLFRRRPPRVETLKLPLPIANTLDLILVDETTAYNLADALADCLPLNVVIAYPMRQNAIRNDHSIRYKGCCLLLSHVPLDQISELCGEVENLFRSSPYITVSEAMKLEV